MEEANSCLQDWVPPLPPSLHSSYRSFQVLLLSLPKHPNPVQDRFISVLPQPFQMTFLSCPEGSQWSDNWDEKQILCSLPPSKCPGVFSRTAPSTALALGPFACLGAFVPASAFFSTSKFLGQTVPLSLSPISIPSLMLFFSIHLFTYLAVPGLSCSRIFCLRCGRQDLLVAACDLLARACGI